MYGRGQDHCVLGDMKVVMVAKSRDATYHKNEGKQQMNRVPAQECYRAALAALSRRSGVWKFVRGHYAASRKCR